MALLPVILDIVDEIYDSLENPSKKNPYAEIPLLFLPPRGEQSGCLRKTKSACQRGSEAAKSDCPCHGQQKECSKEEAKEIHQNEFPKSCPKSGKCHRPAEYPMEKSECEKPKEWNTLAFYDHPWAHRSSSFLPHYPNAAPPFDWMRHWQQGGCGAKPSKDFQLVLNAKCYAPEEITVKVKGRDILIEGKHGEREDEHGFVSRQFNRRYALPDEFDIDTVSSYMTSDGKMIIKASKPKPLGESGERVIPVKRLDSSSEETAKKADESSTTAAADKENVSPASFVLIDDEKPE